MKYKVTKYTIILLISLYLFENIIYLLFNIQIPHSRLNTQNITILSIIFPAFLHANEFHLLRNLIIFLIAMPIIEYEIGSKKTFYLFLYSAIGGLIIYSLYGTIFNLETSARGSSGASMFFMGVLLLNLSYIKIHSEIKSFTFVFMIIFAFEYLKIIFGTTMFSYGYTVLVAHLGGFTIGYIMYIIYRDYNINYNINKYLYYLKIKLNIIIIKL